MSFDRRSFMAGAVALAVVPPGVPVVAKQSLVIDSVNASATRAYINACVRAVMWRRSKEDCVDPHDCYFDKISGKTFILNDKGNFIPMGNSRGDYYALREYIS